MPSQANLPAILHLRDFLNSVGPDPFRPDQGLALQIETSLHLPFQTDLYSDDVELSDLLTTIHFFASPGNPQSYEPDKFIYAWGSFSTSVDPDGSLRLILHAHKLTVRGGGGQLNNGSNLLHYDLETNVYEVSNKASVTFAVSIYFRKETVGQNFRFLRGIPAYLSPDVSLVSRLTHLEQADRWNSRANPVTPTKRPRTLTSSSDSQPQDDDAQACLSSETRLPIGSDLCDEPIGKDATADQLTRLEDGSSADTILPGRRPKRSRKFSKTDSLL
ncbi:unnamed protein product [Penicillium pancosmium]